MKRVKAKSYYKRVMLVAPHQPAPFYREIFNAKRFTVWPLLHDGTYWIEHSFAYNTLQSRIVRRHWPVQHLEDPPQTSASLGLELQHVKLHVVEAKVHDRTPGPLSGRVKAGAVVALAIYLAGVFWSSVPLWLSVPSIFALVAWSTIVLRGGFGNVGVAKQILGITNPFVITPNQLLSRIEQPDAEIVGSQELADNILS